MHMNWQEFEEQIKAEVTGHETPVDTAALWRKLKRKKRRRLAILIWVTLGLTLGGAVIWQKATADHAPQQVLSTGAPVTPKPTIPVAVITTTSTGLPHYLAVPNKAVLSPDSMQENRTSKPGISKNILNKPLADAGTGHSLTFSEAKAGNGTSLTSSVKKAGAGTSLTGSGGNKQIIKSRISDGMVSAMPVSGENLPSDNRLSLNVAAQKNMSEYVVKNARNNLVFSNPAIPDTFYDQPVHPTMQTLPVLSFQSLNVVSKASIIRKDEGIIPPVPFKKKYKPARMAGMEGHYGWWQIAPSADTAVAHQNERTLETIGIGLMGQIPLKKHWALHTGVYYAQYHAVLRWNTVSIVEKLRFVRNQYTDGRIDSTQAGFSYYESQRSVQHYNKITTLAVPFEIHRLIPRKRFTVAPFLGIKAELRLSASGKLLNIEGVPDELYREQYQAPFVLGLSAGCSIQVPVNQHFTLLISPGFNTDLMSRTGIAAPKERFYQANIRLGGYYRW